MLKTNKIAFGTAYLCLLFCLLGCSETAPNNATNQVSPSTRALLPNSEAFHGELGALREQLAVPGLAYAIIQNAEIIYSNGLGTQENGEGEPFTTSTPLNIASVTKNLTTTIVMQLIEEDVLRLDAAVSDYLPNVDLPAGVTVQHLLTHTSEGMPGQEYVYGTRRFGLLGEIIESVTSEPLEVVFRRRIVVPANMQWYESQELSAYNGLVSTVDNMARYVQAIDDDVLLSDTSLERLEIPSLSSRGFALPVSIGWFAQDIQGVRVMWSYGQDDSHDSSSLLFRVPSLKLTLVLLANSASVSNIPRLLMGDVRHSLFAMAFFRLFVGSPGSDLLPGLGTITQILKAETQSQLFENEYSYEHELLGRAYIELVDGNLSEGHELLKVAHQMYDLARKPDPVLHFYLAKFDQPEWLQIIGLEMGYELIDTHPNNRWILNAQASLLARTGSNIEASELHLRITQLPNQNDDFLHKLFNTWSWQALAEINRDVDPEKSQGFLQLILDSGLGGEARENAMKLLAELEAEAALVE